VSRFKVGDRVRCIDASWGLLVGGSIHTIHSTPANVFGASYVKLSADGPCFYASRFELVLPTTPQIHEHEGRRYQEMSRMICPNGVLRIAAEPVPLTRDEIIERASQVLRSRLVDSRQLSAFGEDAIEDAVSCVVDDVMGEQP